MMPRDHAVMDNGSEYVTVHRTFSGGLYIEMRSLEFRVQVGANFSREKAISFLEMLKAMVENSEIVDALGTEVYGYVHAAWPAINPNTKLIIVPFRGWRYARPLVAAMLLSEEQTFSMPEIYREIPWRTFGTSARPDNWHNVYYDDMMDTLFLLKELPGSS